MAKHGHAKKSGVAEEAPAPEVQAALALLESLPVPMFCKGRDGRYLGVNQAWEALFAMPRSAIVGKDLADLYPRNPEIAERHRLKDEELWKRPGTQSYEIPIV